MKAPTSLKRIPKVHSSSFPVKIFEIFKIFVYRFYKIRFKAKQFHVKGTLTSKC